jgi:hypothetical protein
VFPKAMGAFICRHYTLFLILLLMSFLQLTSDEAGEAAYSLKFI